MEKYLLREINLLNGSQYLEEINLYIDTFGLSKKSLVDFKIKFKFKNTLIVSYLIQPNFLISC